MKSSRSPGRHRRRAPSVVVVRSVRSHDDTDRDDPPPPYVMKQSRLHGALEDAHGILVHDHTGSTRPKQLEQLYERMAHEYTPPPPTMAWTANQDDHACAAVATQVAALERQYNAIAAAADGATSFHKTMHTELEAVSSSSFSRDALSTRVDNSAAGASAWYVLGKVVGKGTFGRVQLARHRLSDAHVAIKSYFRDKGATVCSPPPRSSSSSSSSSAAKRLPVKPTSDSDALEWKRVRQEAKLMASLAPHAGLIGFIEAFETPTQLQVVMEFASGGSLCELLKTQPQQRLPEPKARRLFGQLCGAVDALHRQNVIHRDLKLENVLLDEQLDPRIIDFGFSQREFPTTGSDTSCNRTLPTARGVKNFCGTPSYMAPEVVACKSYDGKRVDIWSLGILLYLLLCGKFPFQATNLHQLYQTIRSAPLVFPVGISKDAQHLIQSILVVDPQKRATIATIQAHAWMKPTACDHRPNQVSETLMLPRDRVFDSFMAWEQGLSTVCHALAQLYGLNAGSLLGVVRARGGETGSSRHNSNSRAGVVALVRLTMLAAERQFYAALLQAAPAVSPTPQIADSIDVAVTVNPPPSPRLHAATGGRNTASTTHKQQLEQLIGLVKQSLR